jgi:hypothetical protein
MEKKTANAKKQIVPEELLEAEEKHKDKDGQVERPTKVLIRVVITNVVNAVLLIAVFYLLSQLPKVAGRIKELRSQQLAAQETTDAAIIASELGRSSDKLNTLTNLYAGDNEFIDFVAKTTALREEGVISEVLFPGEIVISSGSLRGLGVDKGFPISLVFQGSEESLNSALSRVLALPYLLAPQDVELEEGEGGWTLRLGLLLVVNDNFAKK